MNDTKERTENERGITSCGSKVKLTKRQKEEYAPVHISNKSFSCNIHSVSSPLVSSSFQIQVEGTPDGT